jgi:hypothetical protein
MVWNERAPVILAPDGKEIDRPDPARWLGDQKSAGLGLGRLSPEGKRVLFSESADGSEYRHVIRPLTGNEKPIEVVTGVLGGRHSFWSRDGRRVYGYGDEPQKAPKRGRNQLGPYERVNWVVDLASGKKSTVQVPSTCAIKDESPDGRHFLTVELGPEQDPNGPVRHRSRTFLTTPGAKPDHRRLAPDLGDLIGLSYSPDGANVLALQPIPGDPFGHAVLLSVNVKTGKGVQLNLTPTEQGMYGACWSPDGTRVAYVWWEAVPVPAAPPVPVGFAAPTGAINSHVMIVDADGNNRKRVHTEKGMRLPVIDWR